MTTTTPSRRQSLSKQIMLMMMVTVCVGLALASLGVFVTDSLLNRRDHRKHTEAMSDIIATACISPIAYNDADDAQRLLTALSAEETVTRSALLDRQLNVLAHYPLSKTAGDWSIAPTPEVNQRFVDGGMEICTPVMFSGEVIGYVFIQTDMREFMGDLQTKLSVGISMLLLAALVCYFLAKHLEKRISKPIHDLAEVVERVTLERDYSLRADAHRSDEIGILIDGFNTMLDEIEQRNASLQKGTERLERRVAVRTQKLRQEMNNRIQAQEALRESQALLLQSQKMEAVGRLAGGVAHDFNNHLAVILGYTEMLQGRDDLNEEDAEDISMIQEAATRAATLTRQLLAFSRKQVLKPKVIDLHELNVSMSKLLQRIIGEDIEMRIETDDNLASVRADPGQLEQVVMNLAVNARDAMPDGGIISIETRNVLLVETYGAPPLEVPPGHYVKLSVTDTGTGIREDLLDKVCEPFFTTKPQGKGTGLGLSTVFGIVKQSDGYLTIVTEIGEGTSIDIYLPRLDKGDVPGTASNERPKELPTGDETILLVEDEEQVRVVANAMLTARGYTVLQAACGADALEICRTHEGELDLLLTDVVMPNMNGRELADEVLKLKPTIRILFMTGYTDDTILEHGVVDHHTAILSKPFTSSGIAQHVRNALDADEVT